MDNQQGDCSDKEIRIKKKAKDCCNTFNDYKGAPKLYKSMVKV